jgi:hypothetical protein
VDRKTKLIQERQDKYVDDLRKRESTPVIQDSSLSTKDEWRVKGANPPINTNEKQGLTSIEEFLQKISGGKKALKSVPVLGGLAAASMSEDASAAIPFLGDAENAGMSAEDENAMLNEYNARRDYDNSQASKDARKAALMKIMK